MPAPDASAFIDCVDPADKPIGKVRRSEVFQEHAAFRVVHVFVFNDEGELLLQQLGRGRNRNPLRWGSSVAGYLNAGEDYFDGAVRRLREELGLKTPLIKFGSAVMKDVMDDQAARKFITLYLTSSSRFSVGDPGHIESLRFEPIPGIESWMLRSPADFTETFRFVFRFYRSVHSLPTAAV